MATKYFTLLLILGFHSSCNNKKNSIIGSGAAIPSPINSDENSKTKKKPPLDNVSTETFQVSERYGFGVLGGAQADNFQPILNITGCSEENGHIYGSAVAEEVALLTNRQYINTIKDILGVTLTLDDLIPNGSATGYSSDYEAQSIDNENVRMFFALAEKIAAQHFGMPKMSALIGCDISQNPDACHELFWSSFVTQLLRRPLSQDERERYEELYLEAKKLIDRDSFGMLYVIATIVQSPEFLYRKIGPAAFGDPWQVASFLSYSLWQSPPDKTLLAYAQSGDILKINVIKTEINRLISSPKFVLADFLKEWLRIQSPGAMSKNSERYPAFDSANAKAMQFEFLGQLQSTQTIAHLFDGDNSILSHPYFIASVSPDSPSRSIRRGLTFRSQLLCQSILPPPKDFDEPEVEDGDSDNTIFSRHTQPACIGCHQFIEPIGFAMEALDSIGGVAPGATFENAEITGTFDIDMKIDSYDDFLQSIHSSDQVKRCLSIHAFRHFMGKRESKAATCQITKAYHALRDSKGNLVEMIKALMLAALE